MLDPIFLVFLDICFLQLQNSKHLTCAHHYSILIEGSLLVLWSVPRELQHHTSKEFTIKFFFKNVEANVEILTGGGEVQVPC